MRPPAPVGGSSFNDPSSSSQWSPLTYEAATSAAGVARVSASGSTVRVEAVGEGSADVTVTASDGDQSARQTFRVTVTNPDPAVLEELYDALGGSNWATNTNWLTDAPLSTWFGVTANAYERVTGLELPDNGLSGSIPAGVGQLTALERLDLRENSLRGAIPSQAGQLTALVHLYVQDNDSLSGPMPTELKDIGTQLDWFDYSATNLCVPEDDLFRAWLSGIPNLNPDPGVDCFRRLTEDAGEDRRPVWLPDRTKTARIAFMSDRDGDWDIYVMDADGKNDPDNLSDDARMSQWPTWSPDGDKIAYNSDDGNDVNLYVMDADGENQKNLTPNHAEYDWRPTWSRDGDSIAFVSYRNNNEIYVVDTDGENQTNLSNDTANDYRPEWSPNGDKIAFVSDRDGDWDVYVMDTDGENQTNLTENGVRDRQPVWSPDATRIAFHSRLDGNNDEIYVMDADGGNQTNLTENGARDWRPAWSPDGTSIAFISDRDGNDEIYVMDADGKNQTNLTTNDAQDWRPVWSPDGTRIAFESNRSGNWEIYVIQIK